MARYKIVPRANGKSMHYTVHKALGGWLFPNWSWRPVFDSASHSVCEQWIRDTQFTESPAGQALALKREQQKREDYERFQRFLKAEAENGWHYHAARHCLVNAQGELRLL